MGRWLDRLKKEDGATPTPTPTPAPKPEPKKVPIARDQDIPPSIKELITLIGTQCPLLREDKPHIEKGLLSIPLKWHVQLADKYIETWRLAYENEPSEVKKENAGRRAANLIISHLLIGRGSR